MDELRNPNNGGNLQEQEEELHQMHSKEHHQFFINDDIDSGCSTPYVSAPSSPGRSFNGYFYSAPASPMHYVLSSSSSSAATSSDHVSISSSGSFEFEFSARFPSNGGVSSSTETGSMSSADELFLNGQIRPMKLSSHLQRPQILAPLLDLEVEDEEDDERKGLRDFQGLKREDSMVRGREIRLRNRSLHRRARSMSPLRNAPSHQWHEDDDDDDDDDEEERVDREERVDVDLDLEEEKRTEEETPSTGETPCVSASSSRSSSSGRNSKRWVFLKEFLRSKSEGRGSVKEKIWHSISFTPAKEKKPSSASSAKEKANPSSTTEKQKGKSKQSVQSPKKSVNGKPTNGVGKRRVPPSPHELLYTANRAQAEEMKKKTYLPYRQGLFGCLGFSSKGYGAMNAFTRSLNPVTSR